MVFLDKNKENLNKCHKIDMNGSDSLIVESQVKNISGDCQIKSSDSPKHSIQCQHLRRHHTRMKIRSEIDEGYLKYRMSDEPPLESDPISLPPSTVGDPPSSRKVEFGLKINEDVVDEYQGEGSPGEPAAKFMSEMLTVIIEYDVYGKDNFSQELLLDLFVDIDFILNPDL